MIDTTGIDMITSAETRTSALLDMLSLYLDQASEGGDTLPADKIAAIVWQAQINMRDLRDGITEATDAMKEERESNQP